MLETASAAAITALGLACLAFAAFIIFFPLVRTVMGGLQILKIYGLRKSRETDVNTAFESFISDVELGLTMADGGEKTEKQQTGATEKQK